MATRIIGFNSTGTDRQVVTATNTVDLFDGQPFNFPVNDELMENMLYNLDTWGLNYHVYNDHGGVIIERGMLEIQVQGVDDNLSSTGLNKATYVFMNTTNGDAVIRSIEGGEEGRRMVMYNKGPDQVTLEHFANNVPAGQQIICPGDANKALAKGQGALLAHHSGLWYVLLAN